MTKVTICCPQCQSQYSVDESSIGKRAHCKKCDTRFVIPDSDVELDAPMEEPAASKAAAPEGAASGSGKALGGDFERRARAALSKSVPEEKRVAENSSYRNSKISDLTELCELAKEACDKGGKSDASAYIGTIQGAIMIIMAGWVGIRAQVEGNPMLSLHIVGVTMVFATTWKTLKGAIQLWGLSETSGDYFSDAKLNEDIAATAQMVTTLLQKWGLT